MAVYAPDATRVQFCVFDALGNTEQRRHALSKEGEWHRGHVNGIKPGTRYGLRAEGPWAPEAGHRFDASKLLVDPCATELDRAFVFHPALSERGRDTAAFVPKGVVHRPLPKVVRPKPRPPQWIYELPVKAFTMRHPDIPAATRGTVAALRHPSVLRHFKSLAIDTIELMPLMAWIDERHLAALNLSNAWGYNPITFFAPDLRLAPGGFAEIAETIRVLHAEGIQVLLDVVLNHSGESDAAGPTLSMRGLGNATWYRHIHGAPINDTGCGNTLALDHPQVAGHAVRALRHWVDVTGLDGFRFDLATVMGRDGHGFTLGTATIDAIEADPVLTSSILIAEPWDVGPGGYQLGNFPTLWPEWNDRYRDDVRRFWRGDAYAANALATRLAGSSDVFAPRKHPSSSINFIAAHDGFTLADLTRFSSKHNIANGEGNRDGKSDEVTCVGAPAAALLATLFLSRGTPMLTAGDEFGRSQGGNNNAYAQDNDVTWLQWAKADRELQSLVGDLVRLRQDQPLLSQDRFLTGAPHAPGEEPDVEWFGRDGKPPHWSDAEQRFLALTLSDGKSRIALTFNGSSDAIAFPIRARPGMIWERLFSSAPAADCPAHAVCLWRENPT